MPDLHKHIVRSDRSLKPEFQKIVFVLVLFLLIRSGHTQPSLDIKGYVETYKELAVREMKLFRIPASITLAQGIIESNCGKSPLAKEANNHFGIKCHKDWDGEKYYYDDDEKQECFRKYGKAEESFRDHSLFLVSRQRYSALFSLDSGDYTGWAMGLKQAGYATNPDYPNMLIRMIENYKLFLYDQGILTDETRPEPALIENQPGILKGLDKDIEGTNGRSLFRKGYQMPGEKQFELLQTSESGRKVFINNGIPFIFAEEKDTWYSIAKEFRIYGFQVYKQNDLNEKDPITPGQILYLEPKKKGSPVNKHVVQSGETLYSVSQLYGVKLKMILKFNNIKEEDVLNLGSVLNLNNK